MIAHWIEVPVTNFARAAKFYQAIFAADEPIKNMAGGDVSFGHLPGDRGLGSVCLLTAPGFTPSDSGAVAYLSVGDDMAPILARIEAAGGAILLPKSSIGAQGFRAQFRDSEGNRMGLHSVQ